MILGFDPRIKPPPGATVAWEDPQARDLRGCWLFAQGSGPTSVNLASPGSGDAAAVNGPAWVAGRFGPATSLVAASDQRWNCGNPAGLRITGGITIAAHYRHTALQANGSAAQVVAKDDAGQRSYTLDLYRTDSFPSVSGLRFYLNGGTGGNLVEGRLPVAGDERTVVATASGGSGSLYADGRLLTSDTLASSIDDTTSNVLIGRREFAGFEEPIDGRIDFVMIWARAFTAEEVRLLFAEPFRHFSPARPPAAYFSFGTGFRPAWIRQASPLGSGVF